MSIVVRLPDELSASLLTDWLQLVDVAKLDSAYCHRSLRNAYLQTAYSGGLVDDYGEGENAPFHSTYNKREVFNVWILSRGAGVNGLAITLAWELQKEQRRALLKRHGQRITWISYSQYEYGEKGASLSKELLLDLCRYCPNVIHFNSPSRFTPIENMLVGKTWPALRHFVPSPDATVSDLRAILPRCHQLTHLFMPGECGKLKCNTASWIFQCPYQLTHVEIGTACTAIPVDHFMSAEALLALATHGAQLRHLRLHVPHIVGTAFQAIAQHCTLLEVLTLRTPQRHPIANFIASMEKIAARGLLTEFALDAATSGLESVFVDLAQRCPKLAVLSVPQCAITDAVLESLGAHCVKLHTLDVSDSMITDAGLAVLAQRSNQLRVLNIEHCSAVTLEGLVVAQALLPPLQIVACSRDSTVQCKKCLYNSWG